jgi:uncharacterized protein YbjT (DUF2867 family)
LSNNAEVRALVRNESDANKIAALKQKGVQVFQVDTSKKEEMVKHFMGVHCVVSAIAGLKETIVDAQKVIADAAVDAKVVRFIPSDYSSDFTNLLVGQNRNLDARREFHTHLEKLPLQVTTIFNGAFMELLTKEMPLIMFKQKRILCWGNPNQDMEFTTTYNIAEFTAKAALDETTPRYLRIAGDKLSCNDFVQLLTELTGHSYKLFRPGGISLFNVVIRLTRFFSPSKNELYPAWQGMQYMRDMMEGRIVFQKYDNEKYANINWTSIKDFLIQEKVAVK